MPFEPAEVTAARELLNILTGDEPTNSPRNRAEADLRAKQADPLQPKPPQPAVPRGANQTLNPQLSQHLIQLERAKLAPRCHHIKADGVRCGSPAIRHKNFCYVHHQLRIPKPNPIRRLPSLEDANGVQCAIMQVADAVIQKQLDRQTANTLLYALQTAVSNLKRVRFEPPLSKLVQDDTGIL